MREKRKEKEAGTIAHRYPSANHQSIHRWPRSVLCSSAPGQGRVFPGRAHTSVRWIGRWALHHLKATVWACSMKKLMGTQAAQGTVCGHLKGKKKNLAHF